MRLNRLSRFCTLHCNVIHFQTIYILSSNFVSVIFMSIIFSQPGSCLFPILLYRQLAVVSPVYAKYLLQITYCLLVRDFVTDCKCLMYACTFISALNYCSPTHLITYLLSYLLSYLQNAFLLFEFSRPSVG